MPHSFHGITAPSPSPISGGGCFFYTLSLTLAASKKFSIKNDVSNCTITIEYVYLQKQT